MILIEDRYRTQMAHLERLVNTKAQDNLRRFSLWALLGMFPASIGLGWLIADRALRPIGEISDVAREIQAGDLSRRIALEGPHDELRDLAEMLSMAMTSKPSSTRTGTFGTYRGVATLKSTTRTPGAAGAPTSTASNLARAS